MFAWSPLVNAHSYASPLGLSVRESTPIIKFLVASDVFVIVNDHNR